MRKVIVNIARFVLAITLILSGFVKAVDPLGTQYKIADYLAAMHLGQYAPDFVTLASAVLLSAFEFGMGICLLFAIRRRLTSRLAVALMAVMTPLTLWLAVANPVSDCGCFGDAVVLTNWQTLWKNVALLLMAVTVCKWPLDMMRFVSRSNQWVVINYTTLFILILSGWSLYDLPYLDFRPYHVGTDLRKGWQQMMEGQESPYSEFFVEKVSLPAPTDSISQDEEQREDITEPLLCNKGYTFLLISPHLEQADDSQLDRINEVHEYAQYYDYPFYCLTASGKQGINQWCERTGAEYIFCQTDETVLRTIIRSNPGMLLLKDGKIIRKWSHNRLPDENMLTKRLQYTEIGQLPTDSVPGKLITILLWYVLPLVLLTIADRLWMWSRWVKKKQNSNKIFQLINNKKKHEKEDCSRQLEDEPEPARGSGSGQGTE